MSDGYVTRVVALAVTTLLLTASCSGRSDTPTTPPAESDAAPTTGPTLASIPSPGCEPAGDRAPADTRRVVQVDGTERWFHLDTPGRSAGDQPSPLVVDLHGLAEGADIHRLMSDMPAVAREQGFILATPNGTGQPVAWNVSTDASNPDLRFINSLIDDVGAAECTDLSRVYAMGLSNGAMLSSTLACASSGRIAAVATVAGITDPPGCAPDRPVPVVSFHGTDDAILLFNGGVGDLGTALEGGTPTMPDGYTADPDGPGVPASVRAWATRNGCEEAPSDERIAPDVVRRTYRCPVGADVVSHVVEGGGHSWPGSRFSASLASVVGPTTGSIDASRVAWEFLSRHRLPQD